MTKVKQIAFISLLQLIFLSGCAAPTQSVKTQDAVIIGGIRPVTQDGMGCLPAVLKMIMRYNGVDMDKRKIAEEINQGFGGTKDRDIDPFLNRHGFVSKLIPFSAIKNSINEQVPVIVAGKEFGIGQIGHVVLVVGYNEKNYYIIDPVVGGVTQRYGEDLKYWNQGKWCAIVKRK